ncbi:RNA polymerase sigma factor [Pedobacter endophyticus]|uniref:Sigma-70 family RNA polymerase sigma factor n=1 Tax=Pedobacter endophyticus TaxID=2789740 RepID=A0A7S9PYB9_9SPHI|nr:sigma-70 family RNA polymerase sigma factor [Pedobacter endophyticus]QPH39008.1 sigma-70 family RNA polymerase sigma factor [Pedobacter endophyticus]
MPIKKVLNIDGDHKDWNSFKSGNWEAYGHIYDAHFKLLSNYGFKFTKDVALIEDCIHDLFVNLWQKRAQLGNPPSVRNYLYKSLRNSIFRKLERGQKFVNLNEEDEYAFHFEVSFDTLLIEDEAKKELQTKLKSAVKTLSARQQEIIYLRFYEGLSYDEAAEIMNLNVSSAYKLLYKAVGKLQQRVKLAELMMILCLLAPEYHLSRIN